MTDAVDLISGDELKAAALELPARCGPRSSASSRPAQHFRQLVHPRADPAVSFDPAQAWEDSVRENAAREPARFQGLLWDLQRLRLFLDR